MTEGFGCALGHSPDYYFICNVRLFGGSCLDSQTKPFDVRTNARISYATRKERVSKSKPIERTGSGGAPLPDTDIPAQQASPADAALISAQVNRDFVEKQAKLQDDLKAAKATQKGH